MKDRPKFFRHCGNGIELRVEQIGPNQWGWSVYHHWLLALPEGERIREPWRVFTTSSEEAAKREAMRVAEVLPRSDEADEAWRDQSDMSERDWKRNLDLRGFRQYPAREGMERWDLGNFG